MPLPSPNLDDRTFAQLVEEARARIAATCPSWTDLSIGDPGMALVDVFAYLTETLIYRFNRVPEKAYVEFLRLLGVTLMPPAAATTNLVFTLSQSLPKPTEIPRGTRVTIARAGSGGDAPVFVTEKTLLIPPGETKGEVAALQCELIQGELLGTGTGAPGQACKVARPPIVARIGSDMDITIGIEANDAEKAARIAGREFNAKFYRTWREVENFTDIGPDPYVYVLDRMSGVITFAPSIKITGADGTLSEAPQTLGAAPPAGREIRAWYCRGGGQAGNVAANTLTVLKDNIPGVSVTNPETAVGGRSEESLENALKRGPQEFHSLERAVTARDFELIAARSGAVSRTRAFTRASLWTFATPGTVEIVLVPYVDEGKRRGLLQAAELQALHTEKARVQIQQVLDERRPLGTTCLVSWARYKCVKMKARIVAHPEEDFVSLRQRVLNRLHETISPVPVAQNQGWRFGQALRISNLYDAVLSEASVSYVDNPQFVVDEVPEKDVACLEADAFQPATWYAGRDDTLYRSLDNGDGWDPCGRFADQSVSVTRANPEFPGLIAVIASDTKGSGSRVHVSFDCGESWDEKARTTYTISDVAWIARDGKPLLLLATFVGLYELSLEPGASLLQIFVRTGDEAVGYYTVATAKDTRGAYFVAVAARETGGAFLSSEGGRGSTFRNVGLAGEDVRLLEIQRDGSRLFLWAGLAASSAGDPGKGCKVTELAAAEDAAGNWDTCNKGWLGGSCVNLTFAQGSIYAGTYDGGVLKLDERSDRAVWQPSDVRCGLPLATKEHPFERTDALASDPAGKILMAAGASGVFRSGDGAQHFENCSRKVFTDKVSLPPNWLFCSGDHEIEVVSEADAN
jgi:Baseplate J-like protein